MNKRKAVIVDLGTVTEAGDYLKFSFRSPYPHLRGVSVFSPEGFEASSSQKASIELAMTCDDGSTNLYNDLIGLRRKHIIEKGSVVRQLDHNVGRNKISGYAKCLANGTGGDLTLKLYLIFDEKED